MKMSPGRLRWRRPGLTRLPSRTHVSPVCEIVTVGTAAHEEALARELFGHPQIVGIEEGNQAAARHRDPTVAGSGWSVPFGSHGAQPSSRWADRSWPERSLAGAVGGTVVDHYHFKVYAEVCAALRDD